uniref:Coiled-coil domain-containing protein 86 n=1 Tax=Panagrolaimus sp. ES5 TaxID=591445 RepID=A0AC34FVG6_9BILA
METSALSQVTKEPRGKPKSGRVWKEPATRDNRLTNIVKAKNLKSSWDKKMKQKADKEQFKSTKEGIRTKMQDEKKALGEARKKKAEQRKANERKSEVVQVIRNTNKLRRANKKLLRKIEKRDTTGIVMETYFSLEAGFTDIDNASIIERAEVVHLLGKEFSSNEIDAIKEFSTSLIWFTYRKNFPAIGK